MFADVSNLLFIYSEIESEWSILGGRCVRVCVCVCSHQQASIPGNRKRCYQERKKGPHSYGLSQKNTGEDNIFFPFFLCFVYILKKSFCVPYEGMPLSQFQNTSGWHWPDFTVFILLFPPPPATALCSSGPAPQRWIHPIGREVRRDVWPHC